MEGVQQGEDSTQALIRGERAKSKAAMEAAEAHKRIAEIEAQKRINADTEALKETEGRRKVLSHANEPVSYRKYTIDEIEIATDYFAEERKIGEGGYGPVYKCHLDHTLVAVKVLRPDAAQGMSQFQQEVRVFLVFVSSWVNLGSITSCLDAGMVMRTSQFMVYCVWCNKTVFEKYVKENI